VTTWDKRANIMDPSQTQRAFNTISPIKGAAVTGFDEQNANLSAKGIFGVKNKSMLETEAIFEEKFEPLHGKHQLMPGSRLTIRQIEARELEEQRYSELQASLRVQSQVEEQF